jgi:hypothetical protein
MKSTVTIFLRELNRVEGQIKEELRQGRTA